MGKLFDESLYLVSGLAAVPADVPADDAALARHRVQTPAVLRPRVLPQAQLREGGVEVPRVQVR